MKDLRKCGKISRKRKTCRTKNRNLDGVAFRVNRNNVWENVCFSDLSEEEMVKVMNGRDINWLKSLCIIFGKRIKEIGDTFDIIAD